MKKVKVEVKQVLRNARGQYLKGSLSPSPGRPPLGATSLDNLLSAIIRVENKKNKKLLDHYIERSFKSDPVLVSVMKKLIPDLAAIAQLDLNQRMSEELAVSIQKKLATRYPAAAKQSQKTPSDR